MRVVRCALLVLLVAPAVSKKATAAAAGFDPVSGSHTAAAEAKEPAAAKAEEGYEDFQGAKVRTPMHAVRGSADHTLVSGQICRLQVSAILA